MDTDASTHSLLGSSSSSSGNGKETGYRVKGRPGRIFGSHCMPGSAARTVDDDRVGARECRELAGDEKEAHPLVQLHRGGCGGPRACMGVV